MRVLYKILYILIMVCWGMSLSGQPTGVWNNLRVREKAMLLSGAELDTATIIPGTLRIWEASSGRLVDSSWYAVRQNRFFWLADSLPVKPPFRLRYRVFPPALTQTVFRLDSASLKRPSGDSLLLGFRYSPYSETPPLIDFRRMDYSGSFSRGLSVGNRQDLVLNSSFNLQLAGDLGDGMEIQAAISDEQIPLQPEGNTLQLREFDRVYIQLKRRGAQLIAGDYDLRQPEGYFLQYFKRLQGASFSLEQKAGSTSRWRNSGSLAISRGKFTRYNLEQQEGNQGPYQLRGPNGERFIVVLAGTEKVWLNGELLQRGLDRDYTIDYNRGELTFTPRRLITRESRITLEFEYSDQNFLRSLYAANSVYQKENFQAYINLFSQQDSRNTTSNLELSEQDRNILREAGDDPAKSVISGLRQQETFNPARVYYELRDTLLECGRHDTILVYSTNPDLARTTARFTFLGPGKGNYKLEEQQVANERLYTWVAPDPLTCEPRGEYEPVIALLPPQQQQLLTIGQQWRPDPRTQWQTEVAFSRFDRNRFSPVDQSDDVGWAAYSSFQKLFPLSISDKGWQLQTNLKYEFVQRHFQPINPYRSPEFLRDWSLADFRGFGATTAATENLVHASARLQHPKAGQAGYTFSTFLRESAYRGARHELDWRLQQGSWKLEGAGSLLNAQSESDNRQFWRPRMSVSRSFPKLKNWLAGMELEAENNTRRNESSDSLLANSFAFHQYRFFLESPESADWKWQVDYRSRQDRLPLAGAFKTATQARELGLSSQWQSANRLRINGNLTYRQLELDSLQTLTGQNDGETFLGRLDLQATALKGALRANTLYELGSGQEPRLEFTFIKVAPGEGAYIWQDSLYNNDGVIQPFEMEVAPFPDQADYIRVSTVSTSFIRTDYVQFNQSLLLEPKVIWRDTKKDFLQFLSKWSSQSSLRINRKTQDQGGSEIWNPLLIDVADSALVSVSAGLRQLFVFNRANPKWELQFGWNDNRNKQIQTSGFESRELREATVQLRWNLAQQWTLRLNAATGQRNSNSELFNSRDYQLRFDKSEAQFTWLPKQNFRTILNYRWQHDSNALTNEPADANTHDLSAELTYNPSANSSLRLRLSRVQIAYDGNPNSPVGFAILNGLQAGRNWLWNLSFDRQLAKSLQLRLSYEGRQTGSARVVHVGRAQVTAVF